MEAAASQVAAMDPYKLEPEQIENMLRYYGDSMSWSDRQLYETVLNAKLNELRTSRPNALLENNRRYGAEPAMYPGQKILRVLGLGR
jgi:hypothetical protein